MKIRAKLKDVVIIPETPFEMNEIKRLVIPILNDPDSRLAIDLEFDYNGGKVTGFRTGGIIKEKW